MSGLNPNSDSLAWLRTSKARPQKAGSDGQGVIQRGDEFGNTVTAIMTGRSLALAREGSSFLVRSPTPGTGLASIAALTALVDTSPFAILTNLNAPGGPSIDVDFIKLIATAAGTAGTSLNWAIKTDAVINRYTSGGSVLAAGGGSANANPGAVNVNPAFPSASMLAVQAGALVAAAASQAARLLDSGVFRTVIPVVGDQYVINFGGHEALMGAGAKNGTVPTDFTHQAPPLSIPPGACALLHLWLPSQSAASSFELIVGYSER